MKIKTYIFIVTFFSFLSAQVFSEYSYTGASQSAMAGSISANTNNESGDI